MSNLDWSYRRYVKEENERGKQYLRDLKIMLLTFLALWLAVVALVMLYLLRM